MAEAVGSKHYCPVCGCSNDVINDPKNWVDMDKHLRRCPRCGSILRGVGRTYTVVKRSPTLDSWRAKPW